MWLTRHTLLIQDDISKAQEKFLFSMAPTIRYPLLSLRECEWNGDICLKQLSLFYEHTKPIACYVGILVPQS